MSGQIPDPNTHEQLAHEDEPTFTLRGQDVTSPLVIMAWITANFETAPAAKLRQAFEHALKMRQYPGRRHAD